MKEEFKINTNLKEFVMALEDLINIFLEEGKMSWAEVIGTLQLVKTKYELFLHLGTNLETEFGTDEENEDDDA